MTDKPDKPRTHANAGRGACAVDSADSVVATDDAARSAADGGSAGDVIGVDLGAHANCVARLGRDGSHDADRYRPALRRPGMRPTGQPTNHTQKGENFR
jgi:hypothetical protein